MMLTPEDMLASCIEGGTHATARTTEGVCIFCGHKILTEEEMVERIFDAINGVRDQFDTEKNEEGYELCSDLLSRLVGWCRPGAAIEFPYKGETETVQQEDIVDYRSEDGHHIQLVRGYKTHHAMMMPEYISIMDPVSKDVFTYNREPKNK